MEGFFVDSHFLNVFSFPLLKGNITTALEKPQSIIITEEGAQRMFGTEDPMGKVIHLKKFGEFEVTGVLKQLPKNSHIQFELLAPFQALEISNKLPEIYCFGRKVVRFEHLHIPASAQNFFGR